MNEGEVIVPIAIFGSMVVVVWLFQFFASRKRIEAFKTLQLAIEKGQPLTPEALQSMARMRSPIADLRWGIVFVAIAAGVGAFGTIISWGATGEMLDFRKGVYGVAMLPLFLGVAFLGLHIFANEAKRR